MPSNHTENYNLSQWEKTDKVLMDDFNADNARIDAAVKAVDQRVDSLSQTVSGQGSALSSHAASLTKLGNCQIYTTTYTGNGTNSRSLSFPGYPAAVWIQEADSPADEMNFICGAAFIPGIMGAATVALSWSDRGVTWTYSKPDTVKMNSSSHRYTVVALLDMSK